ncbi:unnamed protein product [Prunus armeniaca]
MQYTRFGVVLREIRSKYVQGQNAETSLLHNLRHRPPQAARPDPIDPQQLPLPFPTGLCAWNRRKPPESAIKVTGFDRNSRRSYAVIRPPNQSSKVNFRARVWPVLGAQFRPLPASLWGRSKNKSGSK